MEVPYQAEFGNNEQEVERAVKFVCIGLRSAYLLL